VAAGPFPDVARFLLHVLPMNNDMLVFDFVIFLAGYCWKAPNCVSTNFRTSHGSVFLVSCS
jgi:hypothetical protein